MKAWTNWQIAIIVLPGALIVIALVMFAFSDFVEGPALTGASVLSLVQVLAAEDTAARRH